jgi:hypoxanthine phosphoribosyltransferase
MEPPIKWGWPLLHSKGATGKTDSNALDFKRRVRQHQHELAMDEDIEKILFHTATIQARTDELAARITEDYRGKELTVIAVLTGALMFTADLLRRIPLPLILDCISVASYHGAMETSGEVKFDQLSMPDIEGRHVLVVDDILDSGLTLDAITRRLQQECNPLSIRICVLLSKQKPRRREVTADYIGFEIQDEFVVGYGLDYQERYRNLPFIGVLKQR